ncbi:MAG: ABC transporter permease [Bryobacteraceae bacterium]
MYRDIVFALRTLRRDWVLALCVAATMVLGIGANTAIFTVAYSVMLRPLPYPDSSGLVRISGGATFKRYETILAARSLSGVAAWNVFLSDVTMSAGGAAHDSAKAVRVSANLLSVLGVPPVAGRGFAPGEETDGSCPVMISENYWKLRFAGDPAAIRSAVRIGRVPCTIVGVFATGPLPFPGVDVWLPIQPASVLPQARLHSPMLALIGRVRAGVSVGRANEEVLALNEAYARANPSALDAKRGRPESIAPLREQMVRGVRPALWMLMGAGILLLAIACANIACLLLVRARSRAREIAVRLALGAGRARLMRQLVTESLILALAGGAAGIAVAAAAVRRLDRIPGLDLPRAAEIDLDSSVLLFAAALTIGAGILFGLAPAGIALRTALMNVLRESGETTASGARAISRLFAVGSGSALVVLQVALATVLLIGAGLLVRSVERLAKVDLGFDAGNLLTMRLTLPAGQEGPDFDALTTRLESLPGVRGAAVTLTLPTAGFAGTPVWPVRQSPPPLNERPIAVLQTVTPGYFRTLGIALRSGRVFTQRDSGSSPKVAVINDALARRFWPEYPRESPLGQTILAGASPEPLEIVGVVAGVRQAGLTEPAQPGVYRPRAQAPPMSAMLAVRTSGDPLRVANAIRGEVQAIDPAGSVSGVKTMRGLLNDSEARRRGITMLLALFSAAGLLLAAFGTYGVVAYSVAVRTREFGIRRALGATSAAVLRLVVGQGLRLALAGAALGMAGAAAFSRVLEGLLFEVSATDPVAFGVVALLSLAVAIGASYLPARGATRVEPVAAIRGDR